MANFQLMDAKKLQRLIYLAGNHLRTIKCSCRFQIMTFDNILVHLIELFTSDLDVVEMKRQIRAAKIEFSPI